MYIKPLLSLIFSLTLAGATYAQPKKRQAVTLEPQLIPWSFAATASREAASTFHAGVAEKTASSSTINFVGSNYSSVGVTVFFMDPVTEYLYNVYLPANYIFMLPIGTINPGIYDFTFTPDGAGTIYYNISHHYEGMITGVTTRSGIELYPSSYFVLIQ